MIDDMDVQRFGNAMKRDKIACECKNITYGMIEDAVKAGARTYDEVKEKLKSGTGCKKCCEFIEYLVRDLVKELNEQSISGQKEKCHVGPIAGWPVHTSVDNSKEIIQTVLSADETYAVCLKEDNRAIGSIGLIPPAQSHTKVADDEVEIGYWIGVPFWGKGLIPEAVRKLQEHAFNNLGVSAMWCGYYDGNEKSKKCQEKCGFIFHHTENNKQCTLMGDVRTEHFTRITKKQWQDMKQCI